MLMIVPLMIWSARTLIDSQAWSSAMSMPERIAAMSAMTRGSVSPKNGVGVPWPSTPTAATPTIQPTNAATSIIPSMPMLTTPDRSHMTPHSAGQGDRHRNRDGTVGDERQLGQQVAAELEDEPQDGDPVEAADERVHQTDSFP